MGPGAHVGSLDAVDSFRASLIVYVNKARALLEEAAGEIGRMRDWLRWDRLPYWEAQVRHRRRKLDEAKEALFRSRTVAIRTLTPGDEAAVQSAKRALAEAEDKVLKVKQWINKYDAAVAAAARELEHLRGLTVGKLPNGAASLERVAEKLAAYAEVAPGRPVVPAETEGKEESAE